MAQTTQLPMPYSPTLICEGGPGCSWQDELYAQSQKKKYIYFFFRFLNWFVFLSLRSLPSSLLSPRPSLPLYQQSPPITASLSTTVRPAYRASTVTDREREGGRDREREDSESLTSEQSLHEKGNRGAGSFRALGEKEERNQQPAA